MLSVGNYNGINLSSYQVVFLNETSGIVNTTPLLLSVDNRLILDKTVQLSSQEF